MAGRFATALARFDAVNREDPRRVRDPASGEEIAFELLYARRMSERLARLEPGATEALRLAARAQHIARWRVPRATFPEGRAGYKRWRSELAHVHADLAGAILGEVGYEVETIARVQGLLRKKGPGHGAEAQTLEDVACLVFLEHYFADFATRHERAKLVDIVQKTWKKMSERGHAAAAELGEALPGELRSIVEEALGGGA